MAEHWVCSTWTQQQDHPAVQAEAGSELGASSARQHSQMWRTVQDGSPQGARAFMAYIEDSRSTKHCFSMLTCRLA